VLSWVVLFYHLQEGDTIIIEAAEPGQGLQYYRVPAPLDPLAESDSEDAAAGSGSKAAGGKQKQQQQQQQPLILVHIPSVNRHVNSFGAGNGICSGAAAAAAKKPQLPPSGLNTNNSSSSSLKYDPLSQRGGKKGGSKASGGSKAGGSSNSSNAPAGSSPAPAPEDGDLYDDDMPALEVDTEGLQLLQQQKQQEQPDGPAPVRQGSSNSVSALMSGMDESVAARLDQANLPAFLRTPVRRDGDDNLPTQSN
jgi:hypothetical protein